MSEEVVFRVWTNTAVDTGWQGIRPGDDAATEMMDAVQGEGVGIGRGFIRSERAPIGIRCNGVFAVLDDREVMIAVNAEQFNELPDLVRAEASRIARVATGAGREAERRREKIRQDRALAEAEAARIDREVAIRVADELLKASISLEDPF